MKRTILLSILIFIAAFNVSAQKISDMPRTTGALVDDSSLVPIVDLTEALAANKNKAILLIELRKYFKTDSLDNKIDSILVYFISSTDTTGKWAPAGVYILPADTSNHWAPKGTYLFPSDTSNHWAPKGTYVMPGDTSGRWAPYGLYLFPSDTSNHWAPKGTYLFPSDTSNHWAPKGLYLFPSDTSNHWAPKGVYLFPSDTSNHWAPKGTYLFPSDTSNHWAPKGLYLFPSDTSNHWAPKGTYLFPSDTSNHWAPKGLYLFPSDTSNHWAPKGTYIVPSDTTILHNEIAAVSASAVDVSACSTGNNIYQSAAGVFSAGPKNRGTTADSGAVKTDFPRANIIITQDSSYINVTDTIIVCLPDYSIVLDSIGTYQQLSTGASVVYKFLYSTSSQGTWTAIITSPATITTTTTKTWQSTLNNATLPANGLLGILCTTVTTKPKQAAHHLVGHRVGTNGSNY